MRDEKEPSIKQRAGNILEGTLERTMTATRASDIYLCEQLD